MVFIGLKQLSLIWGLFFFNLFLQILFYIEIYSYNCKRVNQLSQKNHERQNRIEINRVRQTLKTSSRRTSEW